MARVAFDVQGTLRGRYSDRVVKLFRFLESRGHDMIVWSFGGSLAAKEAAAAAGIKATYKSKVMRDFDSDQTCVDVCVDDESNADRILSTEKLILVGDIPQNEEEFPKFVEWYGL